MRRRPPGVSFSWIPFSLPRNVGIVFQEDVFLSFPVACGCWTQRILTPIAREISRIVSIRGRDARNICRSSVNPVGINHIRGAKFVGRERQAVLREPLRIAIREPSGCGNTGCNRSQDVGELYSSRIAFEARSWTNAQNQQRAPRGIGLAVAIRLHATGEGR